MSDESNLLKEVIADAKAIRSTAVANAKLALQEHFSEVMHAQLSEKLKEELQDGDDDALTDFGAETAPTLPPPVVPSAEVAPVSPVAVPPVVPPVEPVVPPVDTFPPTTDGSSTPIQETEDPQGDKVKYTVIGNTPTLKDSSPSDPKKPLAGEKTKDELKSSGQFKDQFKDGTVALKEEKDTSDEDELKDIKEELEKGAEDDDKEVVFENQFAPPVAPVAPATAPQAPVAETEETINFDELMAEIEAESNGTVAPEVAAIPQTQPAMESLRLEVTSLKKNNSQLNEVVSYLRGKLNEVNLLNAKLLYTNKLFKAGNLGNEQKMKIVETMDLTKNVREVKLVYSTLAESFNFGGKSVQTAPSKKVAVTTITEGLASKAVASTKPTKEVLTEGTEMANRFQKLAGIKKQVL